MNIHPEVFVTPDRPTIQIRQPREQVDLDKLLPSVLHAQGWGLGTYFDVQFIDHRREIVIAAASFMVMGVQESINISSPNEYQTITKMVASRRFVRMSPWWENPELNPPVQIPSITDNTSPVAPVDVPKTMKVKKAARG